MMGAAPHPWWKGLLADEEIAAIFAPEAEVQRFLLVEAAWTRALGRVAGAPEAEEVAKAVEAAPILPECLECGVARDGMPIPALVGLIKEHVDAKHADWIHKGLTSQDVMDTALVLAMVEALTLLGTRLSALDRQLLDLHERFGRKQVMAFTRMQPALPTTVAEVVARWRQPLPQLRADLVDAVQRVSRIQWGGPIGIRDHPEAKALGPTFAEVLGLIDPGTSWHTDRSAIAFAAHVLNCLTVATGKIGEDIALMAAVGADQITLSGGGSSAMAHKNNPVKAEALIALADIAAAQNALLSRAARHESHRSGRAWLIENMTLPDLCVVAGASTIQARLLLESINGMGREARR
ncbi:MAG: lyase family protein [Paracoccaceae bacterium]